MIDCLGTWLTAVIDRLGTWEEPLASWQGDFHDQLQDLITAWRARRGLALAVTNEVGWGLVSPYRSGRVFTELLGTGQSGDGCGKRRGDHGRCWPGAAVVTSYDHDR